ncbi:MAG: pyrrolysine--tRNA(Pyl) ligase small subunit [Ruminococcus sp.]
MEEKKTQVRYVHKNQGLYPMIDTIRLWPSRSGILHGIKRASLRGNMIEITTHCGEHFTVWNSKNSRSARWLRNRWCTHPCPRCKVPRWKLSKYSATIFTDNGRGRK